MSGYLGKYALLRLVFIVFASSTLVAGIHMFAPVKTGSVAAALTWQPRIAPPEINVDDQVILPDESFTDIVLADTLTDQDYPAEELTWTISGSTALLAQMADGVVSITAPKDWVGSETLHFEACDFAEACSLDDAVFWVMEDTDEPVTVTFVGNSGFMITVGDTKILIDGIFEGFPGYAQPPDEVERLLSAQPPFDGIDLILATHDHADHFSAERVCQHLQTDPEAVFVSTEAAADEVIAAGCPATSIALQEGERTQMVINGMGLQAMFLSHGDPNYPNLGYIVTVGGRRLFHSGDVDSSLVTVDYLQSTGVLDHPLDLAFIPHFYLRSVRSPVVRAFYPAVIFPIHYVYTTPPMNRELISFCYPDAVLFDQEMESWTMP